MTAEQKIDYMILKIDYMIQSLQLAKEEIAYAKEYLDKRDKVYDTDAKGDDFMQTTIQKWGNSQGIRIPKAFLEALGMMENDLVDLNRVDDNIVITKIKKERELTLEEIFKDYDEENTVQESDWGSPVGKEVW